MTMELKYKIWIEQEGKAFGKGPQQLLEGVAQHGSLSAAAKALNMSYNKAFHLIKDIEDKLGYPLVRSKVGGAKGGGSELTDEALLLISKYTAFMRDCDDVLNELFQKHFCE